MRLHANDLFLIRRQSQIGIRDRLMAVSTGKYAITLLKSGSKVGDGYLVGGETHAAKVDRYGRSHGGSKSFIEVFFGNKIERRLMQTEVVELLS